MRVSICVYVCVCVHLSHHIYSSQHVNIAFVQQYVLGGREVLTTNNCPWSLVSQTHVHPSLTDLDSLITMHAHSIRSLFYLLHSSNHSGRPKCQS